jgi:hypothetical protein
MKIFLVFFFVCISAFAAQKQDPYYDVKIKIKEVPVSLQTMLLIRDWFSQQQIPITIPQPHQGSQGPGFTEIINIGLKIWKIIEDNKPVVNLNLQRASALPYGLRDWSEMENWSDIQVREYQVSYINGFQKEVIKMNLLLTYSYGGTYNSRGQYISQVGVLVKDLSVDWGFVVQAETEVARVVNTGTRENPLALMEMNLKWSVKSIIKQIHEGLHFSIKGNGEVQVY